MATNSTHTTLVKIIHIGDDYGIVEVHHAGKVTEYEVPKGLAQAMQHAVIVGE